MSQGKQMYYHYLRENIKNMKPQFKELAVKAGAYKDDDTVLTGPMDVAKFAELIVQECLVAIDKTNTHHVHTTFDQGLVMATISKSKEAVREHFGIK